MKPIAVTVSSGGRGDYFTLGPGFEMQTSFETRNESGPVTFGGVFTSVPAVVAAMAVHNPVLNKEMPLEQGAPVLAGATPLGIQAEAGPALQAQGGVVVKPLTRRTDMFGLGLDYAMYHKRFWGIPDQRDPSPWQSLGGEFTSAPSAIVWAAGRVDVFAVGIDHSMYTRTCIGENWTSDWQDLGGTFTSAASLISRSPTLLDIFARGADFTLRGNHTDGTSWFGWQNHGGSLATPPVAVSWGPDRIDIFALFKDGALWHRWWDGQFWNDWESLGGNYVGEPAVATWAPGRLDVFVIDATDRELRHHVFSSDHWDDPVKLSIPYSETTVGESPTVFSAAPNRLELFVPMGGHGIRHGKWDGQAWDFVAAGDFNAPQRYRISVDDVRAVTTRARFDDTDGAMASVAVGNTAAQIKTQWIGDIGGGVGGPDSSLTNLLEFDPVTVDLAEPMSFSYLVVNNGHADQAKIMAALATAGNSLSLAGSTSMQEDIAKRVVKFIAVRIIGLVTIDVPVIGSALSILESWLMDKLTEAVFASCDGIVAVEMRAMMGRDLYKLTGNGSNPVVVTTTHHGTDSATGCFGNSEYQVTYTISPD